jgi:NAD(P)H-dependent FMN reductase
MFFGSWNNHSIQPKALSELKEAFEEQGSLVYNLDNALPLVFIFILML